MNSKELEPENEFKYLRAHLILSFGSRHFNYPIAEPADLTSKIPYWRRASISVASKRAIWLEAPPHIGVLKESCKMRNL